MRQPDNFAVKAFELDATDYILKPFEQNRIDQAVERVAAKLNAASLPEKKTLKSRLPQKSRRTREAPIRPNFRRSYQAAFSSAD